MEEIRTASESKGVDEGMRLLERKREEWKTVPINVAVIGNSGVGKSSFINAMRGLTADDTELGAAEVGEKETTLEICSYPHPDNPMLLFWDLPGVGANRYPKASYLADIKVDRYDFFLLMSATRFTENDTWLGKEIHKRNKKYFFLRTKIAVDIANHKKAHPRNHDDKVVFETILQSTANHLNENGCGKVPMFLIDNYELMKFDFQQLKQQLIDDFPELKKSALVLSIQSTSEQIIQRKMAELRSRIWKSAALAVVRCIPGTSTVVDSGTITEDSVFIFRQLGLDSESLQRYARLYSVSYDDLQSIANKGLGIETVTTTLNATKTAVEIITTNLMPLVTTASVKETARVFIPLIGAVIAGPLAFGGTVVALRLIINTIEKPAIEVMKFVASRADSTGDEATGSYESDKTVDSA